MVGIDKTVAIVKWDGTSSKATIVKRRLFELDCEISDVIINDVKTDERGTFYGGTRVLVKSQPCADGSKPIGAFYNYGSDEGVRKLFGNVTFSNGLTWVPQTKKFYYIDSCTYEIKEFNYDTKTGNLCK